MGLFTRKSRWDRLREATEAVVADGGIRRLGKVTVGVVGGAVAATAASAAVSAVRGQDSK
jgi:hypothetical protein